MESTDTVDAAGAEQQHEVADPAQQADASPASQSEATAGSGDDKSQIQKRFDKLVGQRLAAQREAADLRERLAAFEAGRQSVEPGSKPPDDAPKEGDFNDYGEYLEARAVWRAEKAAEARFQKLQESNAAKARESQAHEQQQSLHRQFQVQVETHAAEVPDFVQSLQASLGSIEMNGPLGQALLHSDKGAALAYYLASNPGELSRLEAITSPIGAATAIARLESRAEAHLQQRTRSRAARQVSPLGGAGGSAGNDRITGKESMEEFVRKRRAQLKR